MKNNLLLASAIATLSLGITNTANAQWTTTGTEAFLSPGITGVSVGASTVLDKMTVQGDIGFSINLGTTVTRKISGRTDKTIFYLYADNDRSDGGTIELCGGNRTQDPGMVRFTTPNTGSGTETAFAFAHWDNIVNDVRYSMQIRNDEKVIIGEDIMFNAPGDYKLYVQEGILTEKIKVALSSDVSWADFVFEDTYNLRTLDEVEDYINENGHLPEVPSTSEVQENGLDLAQMDAKLLQKVEELTLYIIKQQKEIDALKKALNK